MAINLSLFHSPSTQPSAEEKQHYADERRFWERQIRIARGLNWITGIAAVIALVGLGILFGTLKGTDQATTLSNRAWITPFNIPLENPVPKKIGDKIVYLIFYGNTGKNPAFNTSEFHEHFWINVKDLNNGKDPLHSFTIPSNRFPANESCNKATNENGSGVIWPMVASITGPLSIGPFGKDVLAADADFMNGNKLFGIHGCFTYESFGALRHSAYCFFLRPTMTETGLAGIGNWSWGICAGEKQNYAD